MPISFTVSAVIPASAKAIYDAWLDGKQHALMTNTKSAKGSTEVGGAHEAWDGYCSGRNLKLEPGKRIVQSWRTTDFAATDPDSQIDINFAKAPGGTRVTLLHSNVPDGQTGYESGWVNYYFEPMKIYFAAQAKAAAKPKAKTKAKAKPKAKAKVKVKAKAKANSKPKAKAKPAAKRKAKR